MQPLEGIKVLDFSRVFAGPTCTQVLGDMGAEVYKVESIGEGDFSRRSPLAGLKNGVSLSFLSLNRNKKSICLDLRQPDAKKIVFALARQCDVVVQNFRPDVMRRLGLDYSALRPHNPRLIYASISGYGLTGPYQMKAGQDLVAQSMAGAGWMNGERNGPPYPSGIPFADYIAGVSLVQGILAALLVRERTGEGQEVSTSLLEAMLPPQCEQAIAYLGAGINSQKNIRPLYRCYRCKDDKWMVLVGAFRPNPLKDVCAILGLPDLSQDERFNSFEKLNLINADEIEAMLAARFLTRKRGEWIKLLEERDILCGPANQWDEVFADPQVQHNEMVVEFDHPQAGAVQTVGGPIKFSQTPTAVRLPPPLLGQHTDEILDLLGYTREQIDDLRERKVVG